MKRVVLWICVGVAAAAIAVLIALLLTTCVFENHRYTEATCTEPETCLRCGGHRGEPKGHDFLPATCTEPEICARCGERRGEPLGHLFSTATHQNAATCVRCGFVEGDPVAADCEGMTLQWMEVGTPYPYTTASYEDYDVDVTGTAEIVDYAVIDGDETFPAREGYEWHIATVRLVFSGDDAKKNGAQAAWTYGDFYILDDGMAAREGENGLRPFAADWYGMRVQCWQKTGPYTEADWYDRELRFCWQEGVLVPKGYDGVLLILYNYRLAKDATRLYLPASAVLDDAVPVFRMK